MGDQCSDGCTCQTCGYEWNAVDVENAYLTVVAERDAAIARAERAEADARGYQLDREQALQLVRDAEAALVDSANRRDAMRLRAEQAERLLDALLAGCAEWEQREQVSLHDVPGINEAMRARLSPAESKREG